MISEEIINKYMKEIPEEIYCAIQPLSNKECWILFILLLKQNKPIKRIDMRNILNITESEIIEILKPLVTAGLVSQKSKIQNIGDFERAIYEPTILGKSIMRGLHCGFFGEIK